MSNYISQTGSDLRSESLEDLAAGRVPVDGQILREITAGMDFLTDFLKQQYLKEYIPQGGSKIKFISGRQGSGKTHLTRILLEDAREEGFLTVSFSAKKVWLHDFREIYQEILRQCNLPEILEGCARQMIREMGYDPDDIREGSNFMDMLSEMHEADVLSKSTIRSMLRTKFTNNSLLDNCFAGCCSLLTGGILGHPMLEQASRDMLLAFLQGDKTVSLAQIRGLGLSPSRITRYNARHLLRSLSEVVHMGGWKGLLIVIDDMETLMNRSSAEINKYTKTRRDDTYESVRQLIDDIDSMRYIMFVFAFDRELMDNDNAGFKSYQALWMRIQNEVVSTRFNRFADILDMDRLADQVYTLPVLDEMAGRLYRILQEHGYPARRLTDEELEKLIGQAEYGGLGLPYLVNHAVQREEEGRGNV